MGVVHPSRRPDRGQSGDSYLPSPLLRAEDPSLSIVFLFQSATLDLVDLDENEAAFSLAVVNFSSRGGENILVVGTAKDTLLSPRSCSSGYLRTYTFAEDGKKLELLHIVSHSMDIRPREHEI